MKTYTHNEIIELVEAHKGGARFQFPSEINPHGETPGWSTHTVILEELMRGFERGNEIRVHPEYKPENTDKVRKLLLYTASSLIETICKDVGIESNKSKVTVTVDGQPSELTIFEFTEGLKEIARE